MKILLHPTYFPNIATFISMIHAEDIVFEVHDNYQKQTYRNRMSVYGANGKLSLTVPVIYSQNNRQLYKDIKIANTDHWQAHHWKTLLSAYSTSPFFEFYKDDLSPLFNEKANNLMTFNLKCLDVIKDCLQWDFNYNITETFNKEPQDISDFRFLVDARKEKNISQQPYTQVFSNKHGFINNLSILDLLFNEGPNALSYLQSQSNILTK